MSATYNPLQLREIFHLEFLRWFARKLEADSFVLKGGVNLRLFFKSIRYSEDMDIDIKGARVERVKKAVMDILAASRGFADSLRSFGIERIVAPDLTTAKQTETTQRFKIHLLTAGGEDLFTKIEFSRRGLKGSRVVEPVSGEILRAYKMPPLLVPHYDAASAAAQKIQALAQRTVLQARDIFDLFVLSSQYQESKQNPAGMSRATLQTAHDNIFLVDFPRFRDTVAAYLKEEDQKTYSSPTVWDEIKLQTAHFLEGFGCEKK
jgi:predicted nucleotidyltransferase component of viral defense system